ncbi:MAG: PP2C family protein-serine/threonine phosphatase [Melioribacteraceae bacterium]|nr:PP2C family protein-serine/threonine phosphatase [Melioribacteraceae bacterium]MCF8353989.1 PP2C family protein-serine/threonine phosphatase [Melioribacteraceae bacterium]MCF8393717.1 PP2C family protein-serine/threonine phosphatase [Melioribacteraceae bacterium]MCF8419541.1 PP2C family protein-serine/threonine phosphatase [Melioribacteraceae bacterium]
MDEDPRFTKTIINDFKSGDLTSSLKKDWEELKDYYLDEEKKHKYSSYNPIRKGLHVTWWLLKKLFFSLSPIRRILLLVGLFFSLSRVEVGQVSSTPVFGVLILLFLILLELKDKLLAKDELEAGRKVQRALMPQENPKIAGWDIWMYTQPANDVGGDLVDYIKTNDKKYDISLADVSGKGLSAALLMAKIQSTLRSLIGKDVSLKELIEKTNKIFFRDSLSNSFASLFYLQISENSEVVNYVNAGHLPPIIIRGNEIEIMQKGGAAIGLMKDAPYTQNSIKLSTGNVLCIFSDGVTEACDKFGDFYGEKRLENLLKRLNAGNAESIGNAIVSSTNNFVGDAKIHDDLSLIILRKM